jgi:hypothetical protein
MEASAKPAVISPVDGPEHLLLALDKNTQAIPWESMPCLRGRPISRVPSLPVLLDQVAFGKIMQPGSKRRMINSKKTHFLLNPSGDLKVTQGTFEGYLKDMQERAGWKGVIGEKVSELEMSRILKDNELVLYVPLVRNRCESLFSGTLVMVVENNISVDPKLGHYLNAQLHSCGDVHLVN